MLPIGVNETGTSNEASVFRLLFAKTAVEGSNLRAVSATFLPSPLLTLR